MIEIPTLLILGAGASVPYGYPTGLNLTRMIINDLSDIEQAESGWTYDLGYDMDDIVSTFHHSFKLSKKYSIDSYLATRDDQNFTELGKIAIVNAISKCESNTSYFDEIKDDWYSYLINQIFDCSYDHIESNNLGIITFNYDRSLEYFLMTALWGTYKLRPYHKMNAHLQKSIPILHMFGSVDLPSESEDRRITDYPSSRSSTQLKEISEGIKIIPEIKDSKVIKNANTLINNSEKIYFLGLNLNNEQNLKLFDLNLFKEKEVFGTAYELKMGEISNIKKFFKDNCEIDIKLGGERMKSLDTIKHLSTFI